MLHALARSLGRYDKNKDYSGVTTNEKAKHTREQKMYDKKKLIILRAALIVIGAVVVGTAVWQYFTYYPDIMRREIEIVVIVVSSAVGAALMGLSAKPFYRLGVGIATQFQGVIARVGVKGVAAVIAGLVTGGMLGYLFDVIIRHGIEIVAVRVLLDILVAAALAALCCYGFTLWLAADGRQEPSAPSPRGYMLTASCFFDDGVYAAASALINATVSDGAVKALWKFGENGDALERLKKVMESGLVGTVSCPDDAFDTLEKYIAHETETAKQKRLKTVGAENEFGNSYEVPITLFARFTQDEIAKFCHSTADERFSQDDVDGGGQIIIDK